MNDLQIKNFQKNPDKSLMFDNQGNLISNKHTTLTKNVVIIEIGISNVG